VTFYQIPPYFEFDDRYEVLFSYVFTDEVNVLELNHFFFVQSAKQTSYLVHGILEGLG
jgi:hypothetical protein